MQHVKELVHPVQQRRRRWRKKRLLPNAFPLTRFQNTYKGLSIKRYCGHTQWRFILKEELELAFDFFAGALWMRRMFKKKRRMYLKRIQASLMDVKEITSVKKKSKFNNTVSVKVTLHGMFSLFTTNLVWGVKVVRFLLAI